MDLYSTASGGGVPTLSHASAQLDPLYLPDLGDFDAKNDLMDCGMGFSFPELGSLGGMDFDKLDQLVRMEADLERIERLERLEVEIGSLETEMEDQQLIHSLSGASTTGRWSLTDNLMESNFTSSYGVAAAIDSDSTDIIVNPLSVLPVTSTSSSNSVTLNSGWTSFLQQPAVNVPSPIPASPASPVVVPKLVKQMSTSSDSGAGFPKPGYSYSCLIALALKNSKSGCLPVSEIYRFMCEHFPYFRTAPAGWKNSVRHNLSLNKCFEKVERVVTPSTNNAATRKGCLWTLNPAKAAKMDEEVLKWSRKDPSAIKRAMAYPEALELLERGEMKMDFAGGASTEEEDEGEGPEEENDCSSPLGTVAQPEPSPPLKTENEQLNVGVSILSHVRRNSTTSSHSKQPQPKVYYSFPTKSYQSASSELVIIGESV